MEAGVDISSKWMVTEVSASLWTKSYSGLTEGDSSMAEYGEQETHLIQDQP